MSKFYTYEKWADTFKPITNPIRSAKYLTNPDNPDVTFETYGEEVEFVQKADNKYIWTEVQGDEGMYITAGYSYVNRLQYYITENPWEDEHTEVPAYCYRQCDCMERMVDGILEYRDDPDPDCKECEEGEVQIPTETREDLIAIYGEDVEIVS